MKRMYLTVLVLFAASVFLNHEEHTEKQMAFKPLADTNSPVCGIYTRPVEAGLADDFFFPFPSKSNRVIVHHGNGWFYFPSQDTSELIDMRVEFERKYPMLELVGSFKEIFATQTRATEQYPLVTQPYKGEFMKYRPRLEPKG